MNPLAAAYRVGMDVAAWAVEGFPVGDAEKRLQVCGGCENFAPGGLCRVCGCYMPLKARLLTARCPEGRWG